jgi:hypothetical protein
MAYFGRKPKKPGSVPGAASGGAEVRQTARLFGLVRKAMGGRQERKGRPGHAVRAQRARRNERGAR